MLARQTPALRSFRTRQNGAATVAIAFLLLLVVSGILTTVLGTTGTLVFDAGSANHRAQALFLAESGLERAAHRFIENSVACASLGETVVMTGTGTFTVSAGVTTNFEGATMTNGYCRVQITGTAAAAQVVRVIEAILYRTNNGSGNNANWKVNGNRSFTCSVPAGESRMLAIGISWTTTVGTAAAITGVTMNGQAMTAITGAQFRDDGAGANSSRFGVQQFRLMNPPVGASLAGTVNMTAEPQGITIGCVPFSGVDQTNPIDGTNTSSDNSDSPSVSVTTTTANSLVFDLVGRDHQGNLTVGPGRIELWNRGSNNRAGAGSYLETSAAGTYQMNWTWTQSRNWAMSAAGIRASTASGSGNRVRLSGSGVQAWREVVANSS